MARMSTTLLLCALAAPLSAQIVFQRTYGGPGGDGSSAVLQTTDGGYILAGFSQWFNVWTDVWLVRTDAYGDTLWTRKYGGTGIDFGCAVLETTDSGFVVAGYVDTAETGEWDAWLLRTDAAGDTLWTRRYGGTGHDAAYSLARTDDDGYILAGYTTSFGVGRKDFYLVRTDEDGDTLWTWTYGGREDDHAFDVEQTEDGGYIIAGTTKSLGAGNSDIYLVRTDEDGNIRWARTYGGTENDIGQAVLLTHDHGYVLVGHTASTGAGGFDAWLIKTDSLGDTLWTRTYGGEGIEMARSVWQTPDSGYVIAGETWSFGAGESDLWLIRTDANGDTLWTRTYGGDSIDQGTCVMGTSDRGYVVCGVSASFTVMAGDAYLIKTDSAGRAAIQEPGRPAVRGPAFASTVLSRSHLLATLEQNPDHTLFDASGRLIFNPQSAIINGGVLFLRSPSSTRKVLVTH